MESTKQLENLTWADLKIIDDELKAIKEFDINLLKFRDLWVVCSQIKIRGVELYKGADDQESGIITSDQGKTGYLLKQQEEACKAAEHLFRQQ